MDDFCISIGLESLIPDSVIPESPSDLAIFKDKPFIGTTFIWGFKPSKINPSEFIDGKILDPVDGKLYDGKAKLNRKGNRMIIRGYLNNSPIGRSATWIKQ